MALISYNENSANSAGIGQGVSESGAYTGVIYAKSVTASTGSKGIEFTLKGNQDCNYLTSYYQKKDGSEIRGGLNIINAIMGLFAITEINERPAMKNGQPVQDDNGDAIIIIPELNNKEIGLVLQKTLYTKNNNESGYKFDIVMPFNAKTRQTMQEMNTRAPASAVDMILKTLTDKDERVAPQGYEQSINNATASRPVSKFDQVRQAEQTSQTAQFDDDDDFPY